MSNLPDSAADSSDPVRIQAMDLFDRCLAQGDPTPIVAFVERQVALQPTDFDLLRDFADDLQQRIVSLRSSLYELRHKLVTTCTQQFGIDITSLFPAEALTEMYTVEPLQALGFIYSRRSDLNRHEQQILHRQVHESILTARQIHGDMEMTEMLYYLVLDWFDALCAVSSRREWWNDYPPLHDLPH